MDIDALWAYEDAPQQGLGLMRLTDENWGDHDRDPGALVEAAVEAGITLLDTAELYGNEELVGRAVGALRDRVSLCSKFGVYWGQSGDFDDWSVRADPASVRSAIEGSLRRLKTDTIDLYYLHHRSDETPIEETVAAMAELRQAGKIRAVGLSNVTIEDIRRAHAVHPIHAVQQEWSLSHREVEEMLPTLTELRITLVAHSPLGHGQLQDVSGSPLAQALRDVAARHNVSSGQVALAWVHSQGRQLNQAVTPLAGTTRISHLRENLAAASLQLATEDVRKLSAAAA